MPMVWTQKELTDMANSFPGGTFFYGSGPQPDRHSLEVYTRTWNCTQEFRHHARLEHPDIYGALMAPLKECPQFLGDPAAGHIISWRIQHGR